MHLQSLERENDLLREQLKKYVELVQAQRKESSARSTEHIANTVASKGEARGSRNDTLTSPNTQRCISKTAKYILRVCFPALPPSLSPLPGDESSLDSADLQRTASPSTEHKLTEVGGSTAGGGGVVTGGHSCCVSLCVCMRVCRWLRCMES